MAEDLRRFQHPGFAEIYRRISPVAARRGSAAHRERMLAGLSGRILEVGAGNGLNFAHYPPTVAEVVAVEPEDRLRALAERAAGQVAVPIRVIRGHADELPVEEASFDAAVASLILCSVPAPAATLSEIQRVLKPGGQLRFYEHVRSSGTTRGKLEDLITPIWRRAAAGCHLNRATAEAITAAGFEIQELRRFPFRAIPFMPGADHILGCATKRS